MLPIDAPLVATLVAEQFPQWQHLPIKEVVPNGWDNRTFRLGNEMLVRLPSRQEYAAQVAKEQKWLPLLAPHFSLPIPEPIATGQPCQEFTWHWSIYRWLPGTSANMLPREELDLHNIATQLGTFLNQLHAIDSTQGPEPGSHNYHRGAHPSFYNEQTTGLIDTMLNGDDKKQAHKVWQKALTSTWQQPPVWIHGDLYPSNILCLNGRLSAVIDFGCMGVGDPACDLVAAWVLLDTKSTEQLKSMIDLDQGTWDRARGWALWKALIQLKTVAARDTNDADEQKRIIQTILNEQ